MSSAASSASNDARAARDGAITAIEFSPFQGSPVGQPIGERNDRDPVLRSAVALLRDVALLSELTGPRA